MGLKKDIPTPVHISV